MKTICIFLVAIFSLQTGYSQEFKISENYYVTLHGTLDDTNEKKVMGSLLARTNDKDAITQFPISNLDMIHSIDISVLENPALNGIRRVLKIDVNYVEYCNYIVSSYVLETSKGDFISLPIVTNEDCGDTNKAFVYLFPSQPFGLENQILTSEITFNNNEITKASFEDSFIWNDDAHGTTGTLYPNY